MDASYGVAEERLVVDRDAPPATPGSATHASAAAALAPMSSGSDAHLPPGPGTTEAEADAPCGAFIVRLAAGPSEQYLR